MPGRPPRLRATGIRVGITRPPSYGRRCTL
jgi:hypothetical protein